MKLIHLLTATAAVALLGGAAQAQTKAPAGPTPGSVTGDWNGAHAPSDDKQYQEKVTVPIGSTATSTTADVAPPPAEPAASASTDVTASAATTAAADTSASASFTSMTVTNGPVPDTAENRAKYGQPMSRAGKRTAVAGN
jgi:hypothetical protein